MDVAQLQGFFNEPNEFEGINEEELRQIVAALRGISDKLDNDVRFTDTIQGVAAGSIIGTPYTILIELIRNFVRLASQTPSISGEVVKKVIRIFLSMWESKELSRHVLQEFETDIPLEIQQMNDEFLYQYYNILTKGMEHVKNIRLMVVGMFEVGKTSLVNNLIETPEEASNDTERKGKTKPDSTDGIDVIHCNITDDRKWVVDELFDHDTSERIKEVKRTMKPDLPSPASDDVHASNKDGLAPDQEVNEKQNIVEEKPEDVEIIAALKEKLECNDDQVFNSYIESILSGLMKPSNIRPLSAKVSIWDFAGQYIYYSTHHFFLNARSIYLLLMDVSKPMTHKVKESSDFPLSGFLHRDFTCIEAFKFWLNSIYLYSSQNIQNAEKPTVILIGTHKDELRGSESEKDQQKEKYFNDALKSFIDTPVLKLVHRKKFLINNLDSEEDFQMIRNKVLELAEDQPYWNEERPATWIPLERAFHGFKSEGKEIITFEDVKEAGRQNDVRIESEEELTLFLQFQNSLGNILYYKTKSLKNHVILSPQWIIDAFRCFVTHNVPDKKPTQLGLWDDLEKRAILTPELIDEIIDNNKNFKDYKKEIIEYMEYLDMIAKPVKDVIESRGCHKEVTNMPSLEDTANAEYRVIDDDLEMDFVGTPVQAKAMAFPEIKPVLKEVSNETFTGSCSNSSLMSEFYIVPSLLQSRPEREKFSLLIDPSCASKTPILCLKFSNGFMPPSVFHRLIAVCLKSYQVVTEKGEFQLFNGLAQFYVEKTCILSIWFQDNIIYARLCFYTKDTNGISQNVRKFLIDKLTDILSILPEESRINEILPFEEYIQCSEITTFEPGVGLLRMKDFLYKDVMCDYPEVHKVSKNDAIGLWCHGLIEKQGKCAIEEDVLKRKPSPKELVRIALKCIGKEYLKLGRALNVTNAKLQQIRDDDRYHAPTRIYHILFECYQQNNFTIGRLRNAMIFVDSDIETFDRIFTDKFFLENELDREQDVDFSSQPSEQDLASLASGIGDEYWLLAVELGISETKIQQLRMDNLFAATRVYQILLEWKKKGETLQELGKAMLLVGAKIEAFYKIFRHSQ